jgi:Baseplate J-like protein
MVADFRQYVNMRPLDVEPAQLYLESIEVARSVFPDFELRPGTIEDAMFQAFSYMSALNIGAINRLPDALMLGVGKMIGTPYADGSRATMDVLFTANSNSGAIVPAGTLIGRSMTIEDTPVQYVFETNSELTINSNTVGDPLPTGTVSCTCQTIGVIPQIDISTDLNILSFSPSLYTAVANGNFVQGLDAEPIDSFLDRTISNLASFSSALTTAAQAQNYVLVENPSLVTRCRVYDLTDPDGTYLVGGSTSAGKVAVFAYGPGRLLTTGEKTTIETALINRAVAGLEIGVLDPTLVDFNITATVLYDPSFNSTVLLELLKNQLLQAFSPKNCQFSEERLRYNDVLQNFYTQPAVVHVTNLTVGNTETATITGASVSGSSVTYTATNTFAVNDVVTVTGITPSSLNISNKIITARTNSNFTVGASGGATGVYSSGGSATAKYPNWGANDGNDLLYYKKGTLLNLSEGNINITLTAYSS